MILFRHPASLLRRSEPLRTALIAAAFWTLAAIALTELRYAHFGGLPQVEGVVARLTMVCCVLLLGLVGARCATAWAATGLAGMAAFAGVVGFSGGFSEWSRLRTTAEIEVPTSHSASRIGGPHNLYLMLLGEAGIVPLLLFVSAIAPAAARAMGSAQVACPGCDRGLGRRDRPVLFTLPASFRRRRVHVPRRVERRDRDGARRRPPARYGGVSSDRW